MTEKPKGLEVLNEDVLRGFGLWVEPGHDEAHKEMSGGLEPIPPLGTVEDYTKK